MTASLPDEAPVDEVIEHGRLTVDRAARSAADRSSGDEPRDDVSLHYVTAGPADGDLVLLLHGFPDHWYTWRHQIPALADAGFRVVAPDVRGANRSDKPPDVAAYTLPRLVADAAGLIRSFDRDSARVVGHDFGGLAGWQLAHEQPALVDRLVALNSPHLSVFGRYLRTSPKQVAKSWYVLYFQLPRLPEWGLTRDDYAILETIYRENTAPGAITDEDIRRFKRAFAREGTARAMLDWYRALFRWFWGETLRERGLPAMPVDVPTLLCWGEQDHALEAGMIEDHHEWVDDLLVERYPEAGHWVQFDARDRVTGALRSFL